MTTNTKNNSAVVDILGQRMIAIKKYIKGVKTEIHSPAPSTNPPTSSRTTRRRSTCGGWW